MAQNRLGYIDDLVVGQVVQCLADGNFSVEMGAVAGGLVFHYRPLDGVEVEVESGAGGG